MMNAWVMGLSGLVALLAAAGQAAGAHGVTARAALRVKGTITVELSITSGDVEVKPGKAGEVVLEVDDENARPALSVEGNRVVARLDQGSGDVILWVPRGSHIELNSTSGDIAVSGVGNADLRATSGSIDVRRATSLIARVVSGRVRASGIPGLVRIKTVSGSAQIDASASNGAARLEFETTSGDLEWTGACGRDCRVRAATLSGDIELALARSSSFEVRFSTYSGELEDHIGLVGAHWQGERGRGVRQRGRYGRGAGRIDCETHSGTVELSPSR